MRARILKPRQTEEEITPGSTRKLGEKITVKEMRRKTPCCCALHEYLHLPTGHQKQIGTKS